LSPISLGRPEELDEIVSLIKACAVYMRDVQGIDQWDEDYPDREDIIKDLDSQTLFAYRMEGSVIGIVVLNETQDAEYAEMNWSTTDDQKNLVVHRLAVHPEHQKRGIARQIMDFAEDYARQEGYDAIRLDTFSQNPRNQRFYLNRGYTDIGPVFLTYKKEFPYFCYEFVFTR